ncbi:MAG: hypothetical protein U0232_12590 [Thermomicrobiales bacterium]
MSLTQLAHVELAEGDAGRAGALLTEGAAIFARSATCSTCPGAWRGWRGWRRRGEREARRALRVRDALRARLSGLPLPPVHPAGHARTLGGARGTRGGGVCGSARHGGGRRRRRRCWAKGQARSVGRLPRAGGTESLSPLVRGAALARICAARGG